MQCRTQWQLREKSEFSTMVYGEKNLIKKKKRETFENFSIFFKLVLQCEILSLVLGNLEYS